MLKLRRVYICDRCGKFGRPAIDIRVGAYWLPDNWGQFCRKDFCDKCYAKIKRLFEETEDASNT